MNVTTLNTKTRLRLRFKRWWKSLFPTKPQPVVDDVRYDPKQFRRRR